MDINDIIVSAIICFDYQGILRKVCREGMQNKLSNSILVLEAEGNAN